MAAAGHAAGLAGASRQLPRDGRLVAAGEGSLPRWRVFKPPSDAAAQAAVHQPQPETAEEAGDAPSAAKGSLSIVKSAVLRLEAFCRQQQWEEQHQADRVVRSKSVGAQRATLASLSAEVADAINAKQQLQHSRGSGMAVGPAPLPPLSDMHLQHGRSPGLAVGAAKLPCLSDSEAALRRPSRRLSASLRPGSAPANTPRNAAGALESGSNSSSTENGFSAAAVVPTQDAVPGSGNSSEAEQVGQAPAATGRRRVPLLHLEEVTPELLATGEAQPKQEPVMDAWAEPLAPSTPQRETPQPPAHKGPAHVQGVYLHIKALQQGSRMLLDGEEASARHVQVRRGLRWRWTQLAAPLACQQQWLITMEVKQELMVGLSLSWESLMTHVCTCRLYHLDQPGQLPSCCPACSPHPPKRTAPLPSRISCWAAVCSLHPRKWTTLLPASLSRALWRAASSSECSC